MTIEQVWLETLETPVLVYSFQVENNHTYYVTDIGVLTHNLCEEKYETHHIVERCQEQKFGFTKAQIQDQSNLVRIPRSVHQKISAHYSFKPDYTNGVRVRD